MRPYRRIIAVALLLALGTFVIVGLREARSDPVVRRATFVSYRLPRGTPPLRVALVSDIHVGNLAMPVSRLERIVDQINALHPDAVLIAGDLVNGYSASSQDFHPWDIVAPLSRLRAPLGSFAVLGNHDDYTAPGTVDAALLRAGVTVLHDRAVRVGSIALVGMNLSDMTPEKLAPAMRQARRIGGVPVIMIHAPPWPGLVPQSVPLVLAGHTHCGQIVFPGWDNSFDLLHWAPRYDPRFRCGVTHVSHYTAIVTGGVGAATMTPLRINAPPDFWIITITGPR